MVNWKLSIVVVSSVMLIGGFYFLWSQWEPLERIERIERARKELFGVANADEHETEKVRDLCQKLKAGTKDVPADISLQRILKRCRDFEYIN